jgi:hypothetical protein
VSNIFHVYIRRGRGVLRRGVMYEVRRDGDLMYMRYHTLFYRNRYMCRYDLGSVETYKNLTLISLYVRYGRTIHVGFHLRHALQAEVYCCVPVDRVDAVFTEGVGVLGNWVKFYSTINAAVRRRQEPLESPGVVVVVRINISQCQDFSRRLVESEMMRVAENGLYLFSWVVPHEGRIYMVGKSELAVPHTLIRFEANSDAVAPVSAAACIVAGLGVHEAETQQRADARDLYDALLLEV